MLIPFGKPTGNNIPVNEVGSYLVNATVCQFAGINQKEGDDCQYNMILMIIYQCISTIINILMFKIIREGSSTYFVLINSLKIPIQAWIASYPVIAGRNYSPISWNDFFSFILLIVATIVYNDKSEVIYKKPEEPLLDLESEEKQFENFKEPEENELLLDF
jgi:hypothetical protein